MYLKGMLCFQNIHALCSLLLMWKNSEFEVSLVFKTVAVNSMFYCQSHSTESVGNHP